MTSEPVMFQGKWIESAEDSSVVHPYSAKVCTSVIDINGRLSHAVTGCLKQVNKTHHEMLRHAAGYLFLEGFLDATHMACKGKSSKKAQRQFIASQCDEAILRLQEAGIIPVMPTWFSVAWFVLRWVIIPYIHELLGRYSEVEAK